MQLTLYLKFSVLRVVIEISVSNLSQILPKASHWKVTNR